MMETADLLCRTWDVAETILEKEHNYRNETVFSLGNGYLGSRGTFEENYDFGRGAGMEGNFINGFYESETIRYGEFNYGFPQKSQSMLNLTNAKILRLFCDGEEFDMYNGKVSGYERTLSFREGVLTRTCIWETLSGKKMRITTKRLASFAHKNLLSTQYEIKPLNFSGTVQLLSQIETDVCNHTRENNPLIDYGPYGLSLLTEEIQTEDSDISVISRVKNNGFYLYTGCSHVFGKDTAAKISRTDQTGHVPGILFDIEVAKERPSVLTKQIVYTSDKTNMEACRREGGHLLKECSSVTFAELVDEQIRFLDIFWAKTDVEIDGDDPAQQGLRFNLFHILQSTGRDGRTSVGAKGLSGEGYEGHVFWDTEMYILPLYTHTYPELAKGLLLYRYRTLDAARSHARELGHKTGALYPWRTINGNEASAYYPLGSAQYHINSDIAYALDQYGRLTGEKEFMYHFGLEMLCEISRVFADVGHFSPWKGGKYVISCVTGPDEYNAIVDNNFYTNLGARETLKNTLYWLHELQEDTPGDYREFADRLGLTGEELTRWENIIDKMYLGYDETLDIYVQDDTFLQKKPWDAETDKEKKRGLLYVNFHPLYVFRHQMCKQADTPLAMLLYRHLFSEEELRKNYEFYYPRTVHHSSLSQCIYAIIESRLGKYESAYRNFITSARMDLDDLQHNVHAGIHCANMAGTWMTLTYGLAGMSTTDGNLCFRPYLPEMWNSYTFRITYQGSTLKVRIARDGTAYTLESGKSLSFAHGQKHCTLTDEQPAIRIES